MKTGYIQEKTTNLKLQLKSAGHLPTCELGYSDVWNIFALSLCSALRQKLSRHLYKYVRIFCQVNVQSFPLTLVSSVAFTNLEISEIAITSEHSQILVWCPPNVSAFLFWQNQDFLSIYFAHALYKKINKTA